MTDERVENEKEKEERTESVDRIIRKYAFGSVGIGLIPFPVIDIAALTAVQIKLVRKLAKIYDVPFSKSEVKSFLTSLAGSTVSVSVAGTLSSFAKFIPVVGQTAGALAMPALAGAATYAVGKVFETHFSSGGDFSDFNPEKMKDYYARMLKEGEVIARDMKGDRSRRNA